MAITRWLDCSSMTYELFVIKTNKNVLLFKFFFVISFEMILFYQDLKPSNLAVNEDCELKVSKLIL